MRFLVVSLAATTFLLGAAVPAAASTVNLPAGTKVTVHVLQTLSSGNAKAGRHFSIEAAAPVVVGTRVLIRKGASGTGHVVSATKAQGKSAGTMTLEMDSIHAVDGTLITLTSNAKHMKGSAEKGKASTATIAATIALGPLGLFAHNMVKGKDVTVHPDQALPAWVMTTTAINAP